MEYFKFIFGFLTGVISSYLVALWFHRRAKVENETAQRELYTKLSDRDSKTRQYVGLIVAEVRASLNSLRQGAGESQEIYYLRRSVEEAVESEDFERTIKLCDEWIEASKGTSPTPLLCKATALYYSNPEELGNAINLLDQAIELDRENPGAWFQRSLVRYEKARRVSSRIPSDVFDAALKDLTAAISIETSEPSYFYARGQLHKIAGNIEEAVQDFTRYIALVPDDAEGYRARGFAYRKGDDEELAKQDILLANTMDGTWRLQAEPIAQMMMLGGFWIGVILMGLGFAFEFGFLLVLALISWLILGWGVLLFARAEKADGTFCYESFDLLPRKYWAIFKNDDPWLDLVPPWKPSISEIAKQQKPQAVDRAGS